MVGFLGEGADGCFGGAVEDTRPMKARWLLKNALGLYEDLIQDEGRNSPSLQQVRKEIGPILFVSLLLFNHPFSSLGRREEEESVFFADRGTFTGL